MSNVQLMQDLYEVFGRGDMATVLGAMDPALSGARPRGTRTSPVAAPGWDRTRSCRTCS
jgi:hypothetical protein